MVYSTVLKGKLAEDFAIEYLIARNLRFIQRNFYTAVGEIDIVMIDRSSLVFIEVKSRTDDLDPIINISRRKAQRIFQSIDYFFLRYPQYDGFDYRFDFVAVSSLQNANSAYWIRNLEVGWD